MTKSRKKLKIWRWILLLILIVIVVRFYNKPIVLQEKIEITQGWTFYNFLNFLDKKDILKLKIYLKLHGEDFAKLSTIAQWWYDFSWTYSSQEFIDLILAGPSKEYIPYTVLEWRSIYDIDADLTNKGLIQEGEYLALVMNQESIASYAKEYQFLPNPSITPLVSLEGYLYPDTYYLDKWQNILDQLVQLQLDTFKKKIWDVYQDEINKFYLRVEHDYNLKFSWYDIIILASIVEKEERTDANKATVAWIFLNRLKDGMRLDADITLCYGLQEPYETCTPSVIGRWIYDKSNIFNTRVQAGLLPQPIANVSQATVREVLRYKLSRNYYYLHDNNGYIHYGKTIGEHNANKNKYLK